MIHVSPLSYVVNHLKFPGYETLSRASAELILSIVRAQPEAKVCLPTGATPERTYQLLAEMDGGKSFARVRIIKLDEWGGKRLRC